MARLTAATTLILVLIAAICAALSFTPAADAATGCATPDPTALAVRATPILLSQMSASPGHDDSNLGVAIADASQAGWPCFYQTQGARDIAANLGAGNANDRWAHIADAAQDNNLWPGSVTTWTDLYQQDVLRVEYGNALSQAVRDLQDIVSCGQVAQAASGMYASFWAGRWAQMLNTANNTKGNVVACANLLAG